MSPTKRRLKRIATDAAGYLLILAAVLVSWLPGPGGIPLALAGLGLLSINNKWAKDLRNFLLKHGGKAVQLLFPQNPIVQWLYDILAAVLFIFVAALAWWHNAIWQISLSVVCFFVALFLALMNRDRLGRLRGGRKA
ncbi:MAG TPA: PGPGW domain-containing protein [Candidatus Saccharimonadales bacterium]